MQTYIYSLVSMGGIAIALATGLGIASRVFSVEKDERVEQIEDILPGANCGGCGYAGCSSFAEAVVKGEAAPDGCPVGGEKVANKICEVLGLEASSSEKKIARILCRGGVKETKKRLDYRGIETCKAVDLINGSTKNCQYGCLGYGDCVQACPFEAIKMNDNGLPEIDPDECTGCGNCVRACPQNIISLVPLTAKNHINCSSHDQGKFVRKICEVGCIGCGICVKTCPVDAITLEDNLAVIDYEKCINCGLCAEKCPTGTIEFSGKRIKNIEITEDCVGCTLCAKACPVDAIEGEVKELHTIDEDKCIKCGLCYEKCNVNAIRVEYE